MLEETERIQKEVMNVSSKNLTVLMRLMREGRDKAAEILESADLQLSEAHT